VTGSGDGGGVATSVLDRVLADLAAEGADLDARVAALDEAGWATPTPAQGWDIKRQVAHLAWTDDVSLASSTDPVAFTRVLQEAAQDPTGAVDAAALARSGTPSATLLASWRDGRTALLQALAAVPSGARLPWFGPPMSAASMTTARIMETWAHGQDVADALGQVREPTARLQHVARLGARTHGYAHLVNGLDPPAAPVRVVLTAPDGSTWCFGAGEQTITGPALDWCLLVTQRRPRRSLDLRADGPVAEQWLGIAQAFAGAPGVGRS